MFYRFFRFLGFNVGPYAQSHADSGHEQEYDQEEGL